MYSAHAWLQASDRLLTNLESLSQLIMINTQQQAHKLYIDLNSLENELQNNNSNLRNIKHTKQIGYDYIFLTNTQGKIITSTFNDEITFQFNLTKPLFSAETLQHLLSKKGVSFAPTISLGDSNSSQYLPICKVILTAIGIA
jgi:hypothetical protein